MEELDPELVVIKSEARPRTEIIKSADQRFRRHKFNAKPVSMDGFFFASTKEFNYYKKLREEVISGAIRDLVLQPRYPIVVNDQKICEYRADFKFFDTRTEKWRVVDIKGMDTMPSIIKRKLVKALYNVVVEVI